MMVLKYKGEEFSARAPRHVGGGRYTCNAFKLKTGRPIKNHVTLNALGQMLIRGGKW